MLWASITAPVSFSASVAGDRILLVVGAIVDELHVLRVADGSASSRRLVRSLNAYLGNPQLSPDGTRAMYSHEDVLSNNAYWVSVAGGAEHVVSSDTVPVLFVDWVDATRVRVSQSDGAASMFDLETGRRRRVQSPAGFELIGAKVDTYLWRGTTDGAVLARDSTGRDLARAPIANQIASATAGDGSRVVLVGAAEDGGRQMSMFTRSAASWSKPSSH